MARRTGENRSDLPDAARLAEAASAHPPRVGLIRKMLDAQKRERDYVLAEALKMKEFLPLLMKQRNGERWTAAERRELGQQLRALSQISPYLLALAIPGSVLMLPLLAWWLDRRRSGRRTRITS